MADDWLDAEEAARLLNLPERIVYILIRHGALPSLRWPVRVRRRDLRESLEASRIKPGDLSNRIAATRRTDTAGRG